MKKIIQVTLLLLGICSIAQQGSEVNLPQISPKSPEATAMQKYGEYPVDLSTGVPSINIPLYSIKSGGYTLPIALQYHSSGIKVSQEATWVGLGWNLTAGAQITLDTRDVPDEYNTGFDDMPNADDIITHMATHPNDFYNDIIINAKENSWVKDVYHFSSPTATGKFYFDTYDTQGIVVYPPNAFKVSVSGGVKTKRFTIIDPMGNTYYFENTREYSQTIAQYEERRHTSAWLVDRIVTANKGNLTFSYHDNGTLTQHNYTNSVTQTTVTDPLYRCRDGQSKKGTITPVQKKYVTYITRTKKLKEIQFDQGRILFNIDRNRLDFHTPVNAQVKPGYLSGLQVQHRHSDTGIYTTVKDYLFEYSYFQSTDNSNTHKKYRLRLDGILDQTSKQETSFTYSDITLPSKDSKSLDHWGYYNGITNSNMIPLHMIHNPPNDIVEIGNANRDVNPETIQAGILKEINYPTGGKTKFTYEPNQYYGVDPFVRYNYDTQSLAVHGRGDGSEKPLDEDYCEQGNEVNCPKTKYIHFEATHASGQLTYQIINKNNPIILENKHSIGKITMMVEGRQVVKKISKYTTQKIKMSLILRGKGYLKIEVYGDDIVVHSSFKYFETSTALPANNYIGGLRIQKIENYEGTEPVLIKEYSYTNPTDPTKSSGKTINNMDTSYSSILPTVYESVCCPNTTLPNCAWKDTHTVVYSSSSVTGVESNSVVYQYVKEHTTASGTHNGYTQYQFRIDPDERIDKIGAINIKNTWKRGKLLEKKAYKTIEQKDYIVQKTTNSYTEDTRNTALIRGFKMYQHKTLIGSLNSEIPPPFGVDGAYEVIDYNLAAHWFYQDSQTNTTYFYDRNHVLQDSIKQVTQYQYDNPTHLQLSRTITTDSKGNTINSRIYYPDDIVSKTSMGTPLSDAHFNAIQRLKDNGVERRVGQPIATQTTKNGNTFTQQTNFSTWSNKLTLPQSVQTLQGAYDATTNPMQNRLQYYGYETNGKPIEVSKADGTHIVYIWGYQKQHPIAKVENATYNQVGVYVNALQDKSNLDTDHCRTINCSEEKLRLTQQALRDALPNAMVTTYTYDPLIGLTSTTDPRGYTTYYEYDEFNRLQFIKDDQGKLISENKYNYKN